MRVVERYKVASCKTRGRVVKQRRDVRYKSASCKTRGRVVKEGTKVRVYERERKL